MLQSNYRIIVLLTGMLLGAIGIAALLARDSRPYDLPETVSFNQDIRPILSQNCFVCHGPDSSSRKAGLRLDTYEGATAARDDAAAITPGNPEKSLLLARVASSDPDFIMPPPKSGKPLSQREVALLDRWIGQGASWQKHWAFVAPAMPDLPARLRNAPVSGIIDHFIDQKLEEHALKKSAPAQKGTLARRLSFLLTGLPPQWHDVEYFIQQNDDESYSRLVNHYLTSPAFGERWARHWMDLVRYAETMGHEFDFPISGAWRYRDYLIRAFNDDVPYDQFVREHLAGDLLPQPRYDAETGSNASILGSGFFFLGEGKHSPVSVRQEEADRIDNIIDVTSKTFLGLTVSCARCHDHKFDPIPTREYYSLYGIFESARIAPVAASSKRNAPKIIAQLDSVNARIREVLELSDSVTSRPVAHTAFQDDSLVVLGDFRNAGWQGWMTQGQAFGPRPLEHTVIADSSYAVFNLKSGIASSRYYGPGIPGALRSPTFAIEHDSIAVRAAGIGGSIRLIVDNFQVIRDPLYGNLDVQVDTSAWQTYKMALALVKGRKAYLEFLPGQYDRHAYSLNPQDFIEVQYAVAWSGKDRLNRFEAAATPGADRTQSITDFARQRQMRMLFSQRDSLALLLHDPTHVLGLKDGDAVKSPVFERGSIHRTPGEPVERQFFAALDSGRTAFPATGSGRLAWAKAATDPQNPVTARVIVNRIWHHLFGRGLVKTVDNFGLQGGLPSHPELLDFLALQFMEDGWSIKSLIRHIVETQAFQRATTAISSSLAADPENIYLHHFPLRRLEGEAIRDAMLATAGNLDRTLYGKPVPVHITEFMTGRGKPGKSGPLDGAGRRSIYLAVRRNFLSPFLLTFDKPVPFSTFGRRNTTNVPAQSLALLNDPSVHAQAAFWAKRLLTAGHYTAEARIQDMYRSAFGRDPDVDEMKSAIAFLATQSRRYEIAPDHLLRSQKVWQDYAHTLFNLKEFIYLL